MVGIIGEKLPWVAMSAIGTKQTSVCVVTMSALEVKRAMDTSRVD